MTVESNQEKAAVAYICAACGGFGYADVESLDSGTTFTHDECGGKTVVLLATPNVYTHVVSTAALRALEGREKTP